MQKKLDPNQISLTRNPTRAKSKNPKPDPRAEKLTRPIPTNNPTHHNSQHHTQSREENDGAKIAPIRVIFHLK